MSKSVEICRDLKRLAGIYKQDGPKDEFGRDYVCGMVALSGPILYVSDSYLRLRLPGVYSIDEIRKAAETMYGAENLSRPENILVCFEGDVDEIKNRLSMRILKKRSNKPGSIKINWEESNGRFNSN